MNVLVTIPTYNEKDNIKKICEKVLTLEGNFRILVIDDNSPDGTGVIASELSKKNPDKISVIHRSVKLGLGTAYVEGFRQAFKQDDIDYIFEMDADFSHDPNDLLKLIKGFDDADVVVGSRYTNGLNVKNWEWSRLLISKVSNVFASFVTGLKLTDCTAGFVGYKKEVLKKIDLDNVSANGYGFQIEMKYKAVKNGFRIKEIPIVFYGRNEGKSKFNFKIIWEAFILVWRIKFNTLL